MSFESAYEEVWLTPGETHQGTVPLGNGEVGVNAWIDLAGDLNFFISRTDSYDEYGRLVKVGGGKIKISAAGNTKEVEECFRQVLNIREGTLYAKYGSEGKQVKIRMWVSAYHPVIFVEMETEEDTAPEFHVDIWRNIPGEKLPTKDASSLMHGLPEISVLPDVVLEVSSTGEKCVGWFHHNAETFGYQQNAEIQGMDTFSRKNPLLHRTFGAVVTGYSGDKKIVNAERVDDKILKCKAGKKHVFQIVAHTAHPVTVEEWLAETKTLMKKVEELPIKKHMENHKEWWRKFWQRSWIHLSPASVVVEDENSEKVKAPQFYLSYDGNLRVGVDSNGKSQFQGKFHDFCVYKTEVVKSGTSVKIGEGKAVSQNSIFRKTDFSPMEIEDSAGWVFPRGGSFSVRFRTPEKFTGYQRLLDKIKVGGASGFLLDISPAGNLRLIVGRNISFSKEKLEKNKDYHLEFIFNTKDEVNVLLDEKEILAWRENNHWKVSEDTDVLTKTYALQRYVDACAGRGNFAIMFNGSIFTVPHSSGKGHADYRRWGSGYWWQNCRLPYYSKFMAGDFDLMKPFFTQYYALLPLCEYRVQKYMGKKGAYYPECIYFWGDVFKQSYGTLPWHQRKDRLQQSRWHKWEWVSGLELAHMMLMYYEYTADEAFLREKAVPLANSVVTFFDEYYSTDEKTGKLVMHPSQAVETWWECTNPAPEVAGLHAVLTRLLQLPKSMTSSQQREYWEKLQKKIPDVPLWTDQNGRTRLAPAEKFAKKSNIENPELYPVFPFRLYSFEKPNCEYAINALNYRWDRGAFGWRQEDLFMAHLGLTEQATDNLLKRARKKDADSRFPVFWGPNYDWTPDQCHGGVLTAGIQSLIMQTDGKKIFLFPAFSPKWNVDFKLHAPQNTVIQGSLKDGKVSLIVTPESRRQDIIICSPFSMLSE
ncbi:MAG: DUF5703 domain-containing protein [Planctomycetia bacterium]|nr:DUF5703 domain-containing protein [Planctomycetia bacterium]